MTSRARVLIADDYEPFAEICHQLLKNEFEVVGVARDGFELLEKAAYRRPDLVVLDIRLPKLNGIDASRKLREMFPAMKIVFVTASDPDYFNALVESDADALLSKSSGFDLRATVRKVLMSSPGSVDDKAPVSCCA